MEFNYITSINQLGNFLKDFKLSTEIALDVESTTLDPFTAILILVQIEVNNNIYIFDARKLGKGFIDYLVQLINDSGKQVLGHNIGFDAKILCIQTGEMLTNLYDTMLVEMLTVQGLKKSYYPSLKELVLKYFSVTLDKDTRATFKDFVGEINNEQLVYSAMDVKYLKEIKVKQTEIIAKQKQTDTMNLENKVKVPVAEMELNGVLLDKTYWLGLSDEAKVKGKEIEEKAKEEIIRLIPNIEFSNLLELFDKLSIPAKTKKLRKELEVITDFDSCTRLIKENININSHKQIKTVLNSLLNLGLESVGEEILEKHKNSQILVQLILDYREQEKLFSTYGENLFVDINPVTGRLHVDFNQLGTATGRFSVSRLHQIPRDQKYRKGFIAKDGYLLGAWDYNQQEYRLAGALTGDRKIIEAYLAGKDMHTSTAALLYNISMDEVIKEQRYTGKTINFAVLYWTTAYGLSYNLKIPLSEAIRILDTLEKGYPTFFEYRNAAGNMAWEKGYSVTPCGRKRFFDKRTLFENAYDFDRYKAKIMREAFNHMIQGWAADITKIAMNFVYYNNPFGKELKFYLQLHDEIVFEFREDLKDDVNEFVTDCMLKAEQPFLGEIPAAVEGQIFKYWSKG